jgi:glucose/mannose-6-phosphate isomerase
MGGSGIAATIISELASHESRIPILVSKHYFLPAYINQKSLVIISSYSGNTEEPIEAMKDALKKKIKVVCIASGGKVLEIAKEKGIDCIVIPAGLPPRAGLGYSLVAMFFILHHFGIITNKFKKDFKASIALLEKEGKSIRKEAQKIAETLLEKIPIIYSSAGHEGVSVRFRQQLNENAKMLAWHNVIPEMNHNELVGWTKKDNNLAVVIFRNDSDYSRVKHRMDFSRKLILNYTPQVIEIHSKGKSLIEKAMYQIHVADWISAILAEIK